MTTISEDLEKWRENYRKEREQELLNSWKEDQIKREISCQNKRKKAA